MPFSFGDPNNQDTFAEDLRRAAGFKPFLLEDAKTVLARYGDDPTNIQPNATDTFLYDRAVGKVIDWWKTNKATEPAAASVPSANQVQAVTTPPSVEQQTATTGPLTSPTPTVQPVSSPALTTTASPTQLNKMTMLRVFADLGVPVLTVPPAYALVNETALRNWIIQTGVGQTTPTITSLR